MEADAEKALADLKEKAASVVDAIEKGNAGLYLKFAEKGLEKVSVLLSAQSAFHAWIHVHACLLLFVRHMACIVLVVVLVKKQGNG